jgi:hypothetical protein
MFLQHDSRPGAQQNQPSSGHSSPEGHLGPACAPWAAAMRHSSSSASPAAEARPACWLQEGLQECMA